MFIWDLPQRKEKLLRKGKDKISLPQDVLVARKLDPDAEIKNVPVDAVPSDWRIGGYREEDD